MTNKIRLICTVFALTLVAACNTMEGAGQDIEKAGDKLEDTARDAKN